MNTERNLRLPTTLNRSATTGLRKPQLHRTSPHRLFLDENSALGPGTYEVKSTLRLHDGFTFRGQAREDDKDVSSTQPLSGFRYSYLDSPGPGYYVRMEAGEAKGYSFPAAMQKRQTGAELLGPGSYYYLSKQQKQGHFFSPSPRFAQSPLDRLVAYTPRLHSISKVEKDKIKQRIQENKDLTRFSPESKAQLLRQTAESRAIRLDLTRSTKLLRDEEKHQARLCRFDEKISRMELRLNSQVSTMQEVIIVERTWVSLFAALAVCQSARRGLAGHFVSTKQLKVRKVRHYLKVLQAFTLFLVRLKHKVRKQRVHKVISP